MLALISRLVGSVASLLRSVSGRSAANATDAEDDDVLDAWLDDDGMDATGL